MSLDIWSPMQLVLIAVQNIVLMQSMWSLMEYFLIFALDSKDIESGFLLCIIMGLSTHFLFV